MKRLIAPLSILFVLTALACSDDSSGTQKDGGLKDKNVTEAGSPEAGATTCPKDFPVQVNGVCLALKPNTEGKRTQCAEIVDDCDKTGKTTPNLACITAAAPKAPSGPSSVTLAGFVDVFSGGPDADDIVIEVYEQTALDKAIEDSRKAGTLKAKTFPSAAKALGTDTVSLNWSNKTKPPVDTVRGAARACPKDKKLKLPCVVPATTCTSCDLGGNYCHAGQCIERLRWETRYLIKNIPTNKYLVIRALGKDGFKDGTWSIMAQYNVYLRADAAKCTAGQFNDCINAEGNYELEVNAISKSDYTTIPITAGLSGGVPDGHGAVAGEVHDCDDVKLSAFQVGTYPSPSVLAYFNGNPISTLPDLSRMTFGTNEDGLFSALDIVPGKVMVSAIGLVGGKQVSAGVLQVAVLPDTVTTVTFEGLKPSAL